MQHRFNNFLFSYYPNGHFVISKHKDNDKGWVNKITPFATLALTEVNRELIFKRKVSTKQKNYRKSMKEEKGFAFKDV